jgi:hypothetical protein
MVKVSLPKRIYHFGLGKDLYTLNELVAKYIVLVFLRTQGFEIIYPPLENSRYLWTALATTHIIAEKNGRRFVAQVRYGKKFKLMEWEKKNLLRFKRTGCKPVIAQVFGDLNKDEWQVRWFDIE